MSVNRAIRLGETQVRLTIRGRKIDAPALVVHRMLPSPRLEFEVHCAGLGLVMPDEIEEQMELAESGEVLPVAVANVFISSAVETRIKLRALREPCRFVCSPGAQLARVDFSVLNFPAFFGPEKHIFRTGKRGGTVVGKALLRAGCWKIELKGVRGLKRIEDALKARGGFAITHSGTLRHASGRTFTAAEAEDVLEGLRLFLSFARGAFSAPTRETGFDTAGGKAWVRRGSHMVDAWRYSPSWFDRMHGELLGSVFPGFWRCFADPDWRPVLRSVIYWYVRSNAHGLGAGVDGGLILSQAALERLAWARDQVDGRAAHKIRSALTSAGIGCDIPPACEALRRLAEDLGWEDGPHALTAVRNGLIHPKAKLGAALDDACYEGWDLAQWYVELLLLHLFGHSGDYGNRIAQQWAGTVEKVPWG